MLDADVRPAPDLCRALAAHAETHRLEAFSVATRQRLAGPIDAVVHPSMLATLVYRFGIPGTATASLGRVQANGQCFFATREVLVRTAAIAAARSSRSEDVTMARAIAAKNIPVGFYEADGLVTVEMYDDWRAMIANWPRSLPMRDRYRGASAWLGLLEVLLVSALPPWIALALALRAKPGPATRVLRDVQTALIAMRLATLAGMRRAYVAPGPAYWLSPLADLPVIALLVASTLRRRHAWRGRPLVPEGAR
jgi:dolichol-phosphate mannosyltransferase